MDKKEVYERDFIDKIDKHRNLKEYDVHIIERIIQPNQRILVVGCGGGELCRVLARLGHRVTGIDISEKAIQYASTQDTEHKVEWIREDIEKYICEYLDWQPNPIFNFIIISEVLEHLEEPLKILGWLEEYGERIIWTTPWRDRAEDNLHLHWFDYQPIKLEGFGEEPVYELVEFRRNWVKK